MRGRGHVGSDQRIEDGNQSARTANARIRTNKRFGFSFWLIIVSVIIFVFILFAVFPQTSILLSPFISQFTESPNIATDEGRYCIGALGFFATTLLSAALSSIRRENETKQNIGLEYDDKAALTNYKGSERAQRSKKILSRFPLSKKLLVISGIALVAAIILVVILVVNSISKVNNTKHINATESQAVSTGTGINTLESELPDDEEADATIILTANDEISFQDFEKAKSIIDKRLRIFSVGYNIDIQYDDPQIEFSLPLSAFEGMDVETTLRTCISRPLRLYIIGLKGLTTRESCEITRDLIEDVEVISAKEIDDLLRDNDVDCNSEQPFLKVTLTHDGVFLVNEFISQSEANGLETYFAQDFEDFSSSYSWYGYIVSDTDRSVYYLANFSLPKNELYKSLVYSFRNNPLSDAFSFLIKLSPEADWEEIDDNKNKGEYQQNIDKIFGATVSLEFGSSLDDISEGEFIDQCARIKKRMDVIGKPYCLGYSFIDDRDIIVKSSVARMGPDVMTLLSSSGLMLTSSNRSTYDWITSGFKNIEIKQDSGGFYYIQLTLEEYQIDELREESQKLVKQNGKWLLCTDDCVILASDVKDVIEDGVIILDQMPHILGQNKITEEHLFILKLIQEIENEDVYRAPFSVVDYSFNSDDPDKETVSFGIPHVNEEDNKIKEVLQRVNPEAEMFWSQDDTQFLQIYLHGTTSAGFIDNTFSEVEQIYTECDFDNSSYNEIIFYFVDEKGDQRLRLTFSNAYDRNTKTCWGICAGDVYSTYYDEFMAAVLKREFFNNRNFQMFD